MIQHTPQSSPSEPTQSISELQPLVDRFGRVHRSLRLSVTDVCNIRCQYCMPEEAAPFLPNSSLLSFDQICEFVTAITRVGVSRFRLTGGEPLMRRDLASLARQLSEIPGVDELALTTNGMLLPDQLDDLVRAGVKRLNISLDTLSETTFQRLSRRKGIDKVLAGIEAAANHPDVLLKLNALILRDVNVDEVVELCEFAAKHGAMMRFIEFMPLDAERAWSEQRMVSGEEIRRILGDKLGPLQPMESTDPSRPAKDFRISGLPGGVGFIDTVSAPFCGNCDRLRLTAEGKVRNCLFGTQEWDVAETLRSEHPTQQKAERLIAIVRDCVQAKHRAHGIADPDFEPPKRAMYQIGG